MFNSLYFNKAPTFLKNYYPVKSQGSIQCKDGSFDFSEKEKDAFPNINSRKNILLKKKDKSILQELFNKTNSINNSKGNLSSSYAKFDESLNNKPKKVIFSKLNLDVIKIKGETSPNNATLNTLMNSMRSFMYTSREKFIKENKKHFNFFKMRDRSEGKSLNLKIVNSVQQIKKTSAEKKSIPSQPKEKKKLEVHQHPIIFPLTLNSSRQRNNRMDVSKVPLTAKSNKDFKSLLQQINYSQLNTESSLIGGTSSVSYSKRRNIKEPNYVYKFSNQTTAISTPNHKVKNHSSVLSTQVFKLNKSSINVNELLKKVNNSESDFKLVKNRMKF
jgi:hypothetical protein